MSRLSLVLFLFLLLAAPSFAQSCPGDCDGDGAVTVDELIRAVVISLGDRPLADCTAADRGGDGSVTIDELVAAVDAGLSGCPNGAEPIADVVARDAQGVALRLGETVTTEGVVTVDAGTFANSKLKIFIQDDAAAVMVYHQTSSQVDAFVAGQRLRVTGVVRQFDPTAGAEGRNEGTVLVDVTAGAATVLSDGNPLPEPLPATLADLNGAGGLARTGMLLRVTELQKVGGEWPKVGDRSSQVTVGDASGGGDHVMRFQRLTITAELDALLAGIGDGPFDATVIVVQDDPDPEDGLLDGFELWPRGAGDIGQ